MQRGAGWRTSPSMKHRTLTIQILAGVALLGIGLGIGVGIGVGIGQREAGVPTVSGTMKPVLPAGASTAAERAAVIVE